MKYLVESRSTADSNLEPLKLYFDIRENPLADQWREVLVKNFLGEYSVVPDGHPIEKSWSHHGWVTAWEQTSYSRNIPVVVEQLNYVINIINQELVPDGYPLIDMHFSVDLLKSDQYRDAMNEIHHHFELLIGQKWNVSKWFENTSPRGKFAISHLNHCIHELEFNIGIIKRPEPIYPGGPCDVHAPFYCISYNCRNHLTDEWPKHNQFNELEKNCISYEGHQYFEEEIPWGTIITYYAQTGKTHYDAFRDQDTFIDRDNISGTRYLTGESMIIFNADMPPKKDVIGNEYKELRDAYKNWLIKNDFDIDDVTQAYGFGNLADIDLDCVMPKYGTTPKEVNQTILQYDDIIKLALCDDNYNDVMSRDYSWYTWQDQWNANCELYK